ncbi:MAG: polysaccharide biosynthesis tyrosine autokinase [Desulfobacterales bacterium]|nr:polysaccharide biosynthesis tyrosine autokinase [Desulfobacterales bacterium]
MEQNKSQDIDLRAYLNVLLKRKWIIISVFTLAVLIAFVQARRVVPFYSGTARIVIEQRTANPVTVHEVMTIDTGSRAYLMTQLKIIQSRSVAAEVIRRLDLENEPNFFPKPVDDVFAKITKWYNETVQSCKNQITSLLNTGKKAEATSINTDERQSIEDDEVPSWLISAFIGRIGVYPIKETRLVDVSFSAPDAMLAARVVNELVQTYIDLNLENKLKATQDAARWLTDRVEEERIKVEKAEIALLTYKDEKEIITDLSGSSGNIAAQELARLNAQVVEFESSRVEAETRYKQARALQKNPEMLDSIPEVINNELIREIKKLEMSLYNRMSELSKKYGRNHPQMIAVESELAELKSRMSGEVKRIVNSLQNDYKLALTKEKSMKRVLEQQKRKILDLNKKAIQYRVLQRQSQSAKNMYDLLLTRLKETSLSEEIKTGNIRIIDKAEISYGPVNIWTKRKVRNAMVLGLIIGIGLAFLLEYLDNTIKFPEEIKNRIGIPYLGPVPVFEKSDTESLGDLITVHSPKSTASESFRGIRTGILFSSPDAEPHIIMVTSAGPSEGKTLCASNLAVTMAQAGSKVVIIDCDMRRPRVHKVFDLGRDIGVSTVLIGANEIDEVVVPTGIDNLNIIPCGPIPPNPSEILGSKKMISFLEELKKEYTRIIIDTPPITAVTDAAVLSNQTDGVMVVIRAGDTPRQIVENGVAKLKAVNAHILGGILNAVETGKDSYYYYHHYYYYYGEDGDKKKKKKRKKKSKNAYS